MSFAPEFREISLNECDLQSLLIEARREGFGFLNRLMEDWNDGSNRFNRDGEKLVGVFGENTLIGIGGLNRDPYCRAQIGRLRHLFIHPKHRGTGVGRKLVEILIEDAGDYFPRVRLRTSTTDASTFYKACGFELSDEPDATHVIKTR